MALLLRRRRPKPVLRPIEEAEAYARCHGQRSEEVRIVKIEPRRPRFPTRVTGESLRRSFEERLQKRSDER